MKTKRSKKRRKKRRKVRKSSNINGIRKAYSAPCFDRSNKESNSNKSEKSPETSDRGVENVSNMFEEQPTQCDSLEDANDPEVEEDKTDSDKDVLADVKKQTKIVTALRKTNSAREFKEK